MKPLPTLWILCGLGFLALGCQAGRLQWGGPGDPGRPTDYGPTTDIQQISGGPHLEGPIPDEQFSDEQFANEQIVDGSGYQHRGRIAPPVRVPYFANCWPTSECLVRMKYHTRAASAYQRCRRTSGPASRDYQIGFEQGYVDLARGGLGRTPATAPHKYWGPAYRTPMGQARQQEWLAGYSAGTQMSAEDGLGQYYPVSPNPDAQYFRNDTPSWAMSPGN